MAELGTTQLASVVGPGDQSADPGNGAPVGSPEHLRSTVERAVATMDRAIGLWLARDPAPWLADHASARRNSTEDVRALRAMVRASATAYARRLRQSGVTPERMVVLVKEAVGQLGSHGLATQEVTSDLVLWSIEAYFDD